VTDFEYADDAALCASSPKQLQDLINSFVAYCDRHGLTVNPKKCEVVVFAKSCRAWSGFGDWKVKGKALPRSRKFKYLGVELHDHRHQRLSAAPPELHDCRPLCCEP
jgi:hypothetical protein